MPVREISESEFNEIMVDAKHRFPEFHVAQHAWFASDDNRYVGVVLYGKFDAKRWPWCFSVLRKSPDGKYRTVFGDLKLTDKEDAIAKLKQALEERAAKIRKN